MEYFLGHFAKQFIVNDFEDSEIFKTLHTKAAGISIY